MNKNQLVDYAIKIYMPTSIFFSLKYIEKAEVDEFTYYKLLLSLMVALFNLPNYLVCRKYFISNDGDQAFIKIFSKYSVAINIFFCISLIFAVNWKGGSLEKHILHNLIYIALIIFTYLITIERFEADESVAMVKKWEYCVYILIMLVAYGILMTGIEYAQEYSMLAVTGISFFAAKDKLLSSLHRKKISGGLDVIIFFKKYAREYLPLQLEVLFGFGSIYLTYLTYRTINGSAGVAIINSIHSIILFSVSIYYTLLVYADQKKIGLESGGGEGNGHFYLFDPGLIKYIIFFALVLLGVLDNYWKEAFFLVEFKFPIVLGLVLLYVMAWQVKIGVVYKLNGRNREALGHNIGVFIFSFLFVLIIPSELGAASILIAMLGANYLILCTMIWGVKKYSNILYRKSILDMLIFTAMGAIYCIL